MIGKSGHNQSDASSLLNKELIYRRKPYHLIKISSNLIHAYEQSNLQLIKRVKKPRHARSPVSCFIRFSFPACGNRPNG